MDRDGVGAFTYDQSSSWGVIKTNVQIGQPWSAGGVLLCKKSAGHRVILQSIQPVSIQGDVRLDRIGVRTTHSASPNGQSDPNTSLVGTMRGVPRGLREPAGFVVATTCAAGTVGEIVVTLTKTGRRGGGLDGLRVDYEMDSAPHELVMRFLYGLCGAGSSAAICTDH